MGCNGCYVEISMMSVGVMISEQGERDKIKGEQDVMSNGEKEKGR